MALVLMSHDRKYLSVITGAGGTDPLVSYLETGVVTSAPGQPSRLPLSLFRHKEADWGQGFGLGEIKLL